MKFLSLEMVKKRIDLNYECLKELEHLLLLEESDDKKLELITLVGKMYSAYTTGVYSSSDLEQQIIEIGRGIHYNSSDEVNEGRILIVMSECASVGGHTVLVHNWIKWDDENSYSIVFTNMDEKRTPDFIKNVVKTSGGSISYLSGAYLEKALKLLEISEGFWRILLFTHMEDVVPVLAYSNNQWRRPVYFYNHADFRFSYGLSVSDIILNLNEFDVDKTIRFRGRCKKDSIYFQFPGCGQIDRKRDNVDKKDIRAIINKKYGLENDEKLLVSMGRDFKFENIIGYEFDAYVEDVLRQYGGKCSFFIIGADKEKEKWTQLNKKTGGKARALGIIQRSEMELLISGADAYIFSFPMVADGRYDAESAGVPWLGIDICGREGGEDDIRFADSVAGLVEKTIEILEGNKNKYLTVRNKDEWTKLEWKSKWREVCNGITDHEVHSFFPERYLEKQEYVNCQLMQEEGAREVCHYIYNCSMDEWVRKELYRLDKKYEMGIMRRYISLLEEKCSSLERLSAKRLQLSDKHLQLYLTAASWIGLRQKGKQIDEYLYEQGYRTAAIYGMSYMGRCLAKELQESFIHVLYGIDRNAENLESEIPVFKPLEIPENVDIIINTAIINKAEILDAIKRTDIPIIHLGNLFEEM